MIYKCEYCENYTNRPVKVVQFDQYQTNGKYITWHCPECMGEDLTELYELFDCDGRIFESKEEMYDYFTTIGYSESKIDDLFEYYTVRVEEVDL